MNRNDLKEFVKSNPSLVAMRESTSHPGLYVLKYKKKVFYDSLWNEYLEECRGTVVDENFDVVSRPFTKIYNYGIEEKAPVLDLSTRVEAYRKVNGFMIAVTWYEDNLLISTTGSTDSDYVKMARDLINIERFQNMCKEYPWYTFLFECVHPDDPHIIPEKEGMYLLGYRFNEWDSKVLISGLDRLAIGFDCFLPEYKVTTLGELLKEVKTVKHEGFVFYTSDGASAKIKSPYYLIKKFVARNPRTDKLMRPDIKKSLDEEYYPLIDAIQANIEGYTALDEQARLAWVRNFLEGENDKSRSSLSAA